MLQILWLAILLFQFAAPAQNAGFKISGTVVREDKQDPSRATNGDRIVLSGNGPATSLEIGTGGAFDFTNVQPGTYQIIVTPMVTMQPITVVVTDRDVTGLSVLVPDVVTLRGKVVVDGGGPFPRFQLTFARVDGPAAAPVTVTGATTFTAPLHTGQYRITATGLPRGYSIKSVTVDTADALTQPLKVSTGDSDPINVTLGVSSPPPWVKVTGRVTGSNPLSPPPTGITMNSATAGEVLNANVASDGSFEFPKVLPGSYTAMTSPVTATSTSATLTVGTTDVSNFVIRIPEPKEVTGQIVVPGKLPIPRVIFSISPVGAAPQARGTNFPANPQQDGSFRISLPEGERQIMVVTGSFPPGFSLASFTYGATDLLKNPLRVAATDTAELRLAFDATAVKPVTVSGRVAGLLRTQGVRVVLMSPFFPSVEAPISPDGSFAFSNVIPGNYFGRLSLSGLAAGTTINVANKDITDALITYPRDFIVTGHTIVEGGNAGGTPVVMLDAKNAAGVSKTSGIVNAEVIMLNLKDGEYNVSLRSVPAGYQLKSMTYGTTDLQKAPLKIDGPVTWEIIVRLVPAAR